MPRANKSNKSLKKRFKVTGTGKVKYKKSGKRHLNAHMTGKRKRQLDAPMYVANHKTAVKIIQLMGE